MQHCVNGAELAVELSVVHMKQHCSIRIYFWCRSIAAIYQLYVLLNFQLPYLSRKLDGLFTALISASDNSSLESLNLESLDEESIQPFVACIKWNKDEFAEHLNLEGKLGLY